MKKEYSNGEVTVVWQHKMCIHSKNCWKNLSAVFDPAQRPWVNMEAASTEEIKATIDKCPSGALSYYDTAEGPQEVKSATVQKGSIIAKKEPVQVFVEGGKSYAWCACGRSVDQPFCDGAHNRESDLKPRIFREEKAGDVWLCQCKQTKNPPYCDGTHNKL